MRILILVVMTSLLFSGCAKVKSWLPNGPNSQAPSTKDSTSPALTSATYNAGKIAKVNLNAQFVVITFLPGEVPAIGSRLNVYRNGLKVAEVRITGPQRDNNTVGDITTGEVQVNDEVRAD